MSDEGKFDFYVIKPPFNVNDALTSVETISKNDDKAGKETETSSSSFRTANTSAPVHLFGQFKPNGANVNNLGQLSSNEASSASETGYFTSTISKLSSINNKGGFGSSSASLVASLAPLSSKYQISSFFLFVF